MFIDGLLLVGCLYAVVFAARAGDVTIGGLSYLFIVFVALYFETPWGFFATIAIFTPAIIWCVRLSWVYRRTVRLYAWIDEHDITISDDEVHILAKNFTTAEAREMIKMGYWR